MAEREVTVKPCDYCGSRALGHPLVDCIHNLRDTIDTVRKERDSARVNLDAIALAVGFPRTYDASMLPSKVEHIVEQVWTAERERDEFRAEWDRAMGYWNKCAERVGQLEHEMKIAKICNDSQAEHINTLTLAKQTAERERDEARRERDEVIAVCRGTQMSNAGLRSLEAFSVRVKQMDGVVQAARRLARATTRVTAAHMLGQPSQSEAAKLRREIEQCVAGVEEAVRALDAAQGDG